MRRKALAVISALAILSIAVLIGSVMSALASFEEHEVDYSAIEISDGVLSAEPVDAVRHKPATPELTADLATELPAEDTPVPTTAPLASPIPILSPSALEAPQTEVAAPAAQNAPRFEISMASSVRGSRGNRLRYEITVKNVGEVSLSGLVVRSHVPPGTSWEAHENCDEKGHELNVTYPDNQERLCIGGSKTIPGDSTTHAVEATLKRIGPGTSVTLQYVVDVESSRPSTITNHAHLSGDGVDLESNSTSDAVGG